MSIEARMIESPNGAIAVADVQLGQIMDEAVARGLRRRLSMALGGTDAVLRCRHGDAVMVDGKDCLSRYAVDPMLSVLPVVKVDI